MLQILMNLYLSPHQSRDYVSKAQTGQSADKSAEVISRLRSSSDEGVTYSGDLLAIIETLKNTTELCKANGLRLNNADVEVSLRFTPASYISLHLSPAENRPLMNHTSSSRSLFCFYHLQNYVQTISNLLKEEHRDKWEEAQLVSDKRAAVHHEWQVEEGREKGGRCANVLVT